MSIGGKSDGTGPMTTGSIATPVEIRQPLPPTLAYSDANKIGETAAGALRQLEGPPAAEWINSATGSSGTLVQSEPALAGQAEQAEPSPACRLFNTMVTSIRGVHQYNGRICSGTNGRPVVQIEEPGMPATADL